ncbi:MAG: hypothetical protein V2J16_03550 [Thermoleophilia bacterium]|jgi:hypothetical protein|nr:hypothetical protein [Thermoleophilia bacterium]
MTMWKLALLAGAVTATAVAGVAVAYGGGDVGGRSAPTPTTMVAQMNDEEADGEDPRAGLRDLMQDPDFREDLWALQEQQQTALRAWWDDHGDDPTSDGARDALDELREAHREAMQELMEEYGVEGQGLSGDGSAIQGLMGDEEFRDELWALQDETGEAVQSWWDEYGDDPTSDAARAALEALREKQRAALEALGEKYGVELGGRRLMGRGGGLGAGLLGGAFFGGDLMGGPSGAGHGHGDGGGFDDACGPGAPDDAAGEDSPTTETTRTL